MNTKSILDWAERIAQGETPPEGMRHVCYLFVNQTTFRYEVDHCDHNPSQLIPAYIKKVDK